MNGVSSSLCHGRLEKVPKHSAPGAVVVAQLVEWLLLNRTYVDCQLYWTDEIKRKKAGNDPISSTATKHSWYPCPKFLQNENDLSTSHTLCILNSFCLQQTNKLFQFFSGKLKSETWQWWCTWRWRWWMLSRNFRPGSSFTFFKLLLK